MPADLRVRRVANRANRPTGQPARGEAATWPTGCVAPRYPAGIAATAQAAAPTRPACGPCCAGSTLIP